MAAAQKRTRAGDIKHGGSESRHVKGNGNQDKPSVLLNLQHEGYEVATNTSMGLEVQSKITVIGSAWHAVNLEMSGFLQEPCTTTDLYVRQEMHAVWSRIEDGINKKRTIVITGCPGVGKSISTFCQLVHYATFPNAEERKNCVWIHVKKGDAAMSVKISMFVFVDGALACHWRESNISIDDIARNENFFKRLMDWCVIGRIDIIGLDGTWPDQLLHVKKIIFEGRKRGREFAVVVCTSQQTFPDYSSKLARDIKGEIIRVSGWTEGELKAAHSIGLLEFFDKSTTFTELYFYAGGCIRLYKLCLNDILDFVTGTIGTADDVSKAALFSLSHIFPSWLSQFIAHAVLEYAHRDSLYAFRSITLKCKSYREWILESDFLQRVNRGEKIVLRTDDVRRPSYKIKSPHFIDEYKGDFSDASSVDRLNVNETLFVKPLRFNHDLWDGIVVGKLGENNYLVSFLQVTCRKEHAFRCMYVSEVLGWLFPTVEAKPDVQLWFVIVLQKVEDIEKFHATAADESIVRTWDKYFPSFEERLAVYSLYENGAWCD